MRKIYLSGPMTNYPNMNHEAFNRNTKFLRNLGWDVISPAEMDEELGLDTSQPFSEEQYLNVLRHDYRALTECDSIAFMPGWEKSRGAVLENNFANVLKLDRYRVDADISYFEKELVIAFCGYARSGKNTIAEEFVINDGFEQRGFADSLKSILYALNPIIGSGIVKGKYTQHDRIQNNIDIFGWEAAKSIPEVRELLQRLGTEGGRASLGDNIWIDALFNKPHKAQLVISDLRFENEARAVKERGGKVIRVERPGVGAANDHASEKLNFEVDYIVQNDRSPKEAYMDVKEFLIHEGEFLFSSLPLYGVSA